MMKRKLTAIEKARLRAAKTHAECKYNIGGVEKRVNKPAPPTKVKLKCLDEGGR